MTTKQDESRWMTFEDFERDVWKRALELTAGVPPEFNIMPTVQLVRHAFGMGYDVVPRVEKAG